MGDNGTGKTTLAQAFRWCFYGETDFKDKNLLSKDILDELKSNDSVYIEVSIEFIHNEISYTAKRTVMCKKGINGKVIRDEDRFILSEKKADGKTINYDNEYRNGRRDLAKEEMNKILPKELSRYFFFDGERIEKMGNEIKDGTSDEFPKAVKRLLGLESLSESILHLSGKKMNGDKSSGKNVIDTIMRSYARGSGQKASIASRKKDELDEQLIRNQNFQKEIKEKEKELLDKKYEYQEILKKNGSSKKYEEKRIKLIDEKSKNHAQINTNMKSLFDFFGSDATTLPDFFAIKLIKDVSEYLDKEDIKDKVAPNVNKRTIEFLLEKGSCICGNKIEEGNDEYNELIRLLNFIPPKSIGQLVSEFSKESTNKIKNAEPYYNSFVTGYTNIINTFEDILYKENEINEISNLIKNLKDVRDIENALSKVKIELGQNERNTKNLINKESELKKEIEKLDRDIKEYLEEDEKSKRGLLLQSYAESVYEKIYEEYSRLENETRLELEKNIDSTFSEIYNGGFSLKLDDRYNISIHDKFNDKNDIKNIETSQAQSISIIFAFIIGVMKRAKYVNEKKKGVVDNYGELEAYPLVMDAPLSAFDKTRIKTVSNVISSSAEQVIIFIKDTDGEYAEKYMSDKISNRYKLKKNNEFETLIEVM